MFAINLEDLRLVSYIILSYLISFHFILFFSLQGYGTDIYKGYNYKINDLYIIYRRTC